MALGRKSPIPTEISMEAWTSRTNETLGSTHLFDLPLGLLTSIVSRIFDPLTVVQVLCTCRLFRYVCMSAPLCLRISDTKQDIELGLEDGSQSKYNLGVRTRRLLTSIRSQMPMTKSLDLSGCWILDEDIAAVLADLRCLNCLILDGCQKLTSVVADALAVSVRSGPQALSLERCFGLGAAAAGNLLAASAAEGSQLRCVLLSHLDRLDLPRGSPLLETQEWDLAEDANSVDLLLDPERYGTGSGIRILALHNCGNLGPHELAAVGATCPMLEILMIGGSFEGLCPSIKPDSSSPVTIATAVSAIIKALELIRHLHVLETTFFPETIVEGIREHFGKHVEVWDFCKRESVYAALSLLSSKLGMGPVEHMMNKLHPYDIFEVKQKFGGVKEGAEHISLALRAAVNCSDVRRRTPLHVASIEGDVIMTWGLLSLGASPRLRDSSGATALFNAAWYGHSEICGMLLKSGADVLSRNRSGENPLYVAALRGYTPVVEVLLSHCQANDINWQSADIYGDGWTPLMAAAVADRQDVAMVLLDAAGAPLQINCLTDGCTICKKGKRGAKTAVYKDKKEGASESVRISERKSYPQILDAQNRYGQTALHIAARRASVWFVSNLLHAGASLNIRDEYQKRAVDIAQNQKHMSVTNILRQWEEQLKKRKPPDAGSENLNVYKQSSGYLQSSSVSDKAASKSGFRSATLKKVWKAKDKCGSGTQH